MIASARREDDDDDRVPCVPFVPFRCPYCGRHKPRTSDVDGRMRRHRCMHCGRAYRSWELDATAIPDWKPPESFRE